MNPSDGRVRVLQVMDKCAIRGAPIHGVAKLLLTWWPAFQDTDIDLSLCVLRGEGGACAEFECAGIMVQDLNRARFDPLTVLDLIGIIKRDHIQLLHCHGYGATTFGRLAGALTHVPVVIHEHMIDDNIAFYQKIADWLLSPLTAKGIAISKAVQDFMTGPRSVPTNRMEVIYNCIPTHYCRTFTPKQQRSVAQKYDIPLDGPVVGVVGRLDPVKGHSDFLTGASLVLDAVPSARFVIVGEGELRQHLEDQTRILGIAEQVRFLGHCSNVLEIVALLNVLVVSSHSEGFSLATVEAMALGKPVVATAVGGIPEIIEDGKNGILVPPKDPRKLAQAVQRVLSDRSLQAHLGQNALAQCRARFLAPHTVERLRAIYHGLLGDPKS